MYIQIANKADQSGRSVWGMNCLRSLEHYDRRFESHSRHGCLCVCVYSVFVLSCVSVTVLQRADHSSKESYRLCTKDCGSEKEAKVQQRAAEPLMKEWMNEVTNKRFRSTSESSNLEKQNGFRPGQSCVNNIFGIKLITEKKRTKHRKVRKLLEERWYWKHVTKRSL
jgi:hypothetical protein